MLLKKQTVWLLTMLSLVVVLSVYYITTPELQKNELAGGEQTAKEGTAKDVVKSTATKGGKTVVTTEASDEMFETLRLQMDDSRNMQLEELEEMVASTDLSPEKRSEAFDQMKQLNETAQKEQVLESLIKSMGYEDALVRAEGEQVKITVKTKKKHSAAAANDIIRVVKDEIGEMNYVAVEFQPAK